MSMKQRLEPTRQTGVSVWMQPGVWTQLENWASDWHVPERDEAGAGGTSGDEAGVSETSEDEVKLAHLEASKARLGHLEASGVRLEHQEASWSAWWC